MSRQEYIESLARELGVTIEYSATDTHGVLGYMQDRLITLMPWGMCDEEFQTWLALHELGHMVYDHLGSNFVMESIGATEHLPTEEAEAWAWAMEHAYEGETMSEFTRRKVDAALTGYIRNNGPMYGGNPSVQMVMRAGLVTMTPGRSGELDSC